MEFASYLAGERWSDHPACTHPLLAALARRVNDRVGDERRQSLLELIPQVIGLADRDLRVDARIALRAARTALPVAGDRRQWVMVVAVVNCERLLAELEHRSGSPMSAASQAALDSAPDAVAWSQRHYRPARVSARLFRQQSAPAIVACAVDAIAQSGVPNRNQLLCDLLAGAVEDCATICAPVPSPSPWPSSPPPSRGAADPRRLLHGAH